MDTDREMVYQTQENKRLIVVNKIDKPAAWTIEALRAAGETPVSVEISATAGTGLDGLRQRIAAALDIEPLRDTPAMTNVRHIALVQRAQEAFTRARAAVGQAGGGMPEEFVLADLQDARAALEEVSGRRTTDDLVAHIFSRFCIGK
jgi:tRNA modification GTPase